MKKNDVHTQPLREAPEVTMIDPLVLEGTPSTEEERQQLRVAFATAIMESVILLGLSRPPRIKIKRPA